MNTINQKQLSQDIQSLTASLAKFKKLSKKLEDAMSKPFEHLLKIKLPKNQKIPINKWKSPSNQSYHIPSDRYNIGIPTGRINNLIVVDIDIKKESKKELDGVAKIKEYGPIDTLTIRTPSGGTHYYFKYDDSNDNIKFIIKNYLYTRSGVGGYSIDIRADSGYIVAPPSCINGKPYDIINFSNIATIPETLATFLQA